jgi:hypothetical protein
MSQTKGRTRETRCGAREDNKPFDVRNWGKAIHVGPSGRAEKLAPRLCAVLGLWKAASAEQCWPATPRESSGTTDLHASLVVRAARLPLEVKFNSTRRMGAQNGSARSLQAGAKKSVSPNLCRARIPLAKC